MRTNTRFIGLAIAGVIAGGAIRAGAADVGVTPTKLIVVDKSSASGTAKAVFVAKDAAIDKGPGTDAALIGAQLQMSYDNGVDAGVSGLFAAPQGTKWLVNKTTVAKYVNKDAPTGGGTKVSVIKPGNLVKLVGKNLGDVPLNILSQGGVGSGTAETAYCLQNDTTSNCFCSQLSGCVWKSIASGSGAKLVCKGGSADPSCGGISTRCAGVGSNGTLEPGEQCDDGDGDDSDLCTGACTFCGDTIVTAPEQCDPGAFCTLGTRNGLACDSDDGNPTTGCPGGGFCRTRNVPGCDGNCTLPACGNGNISGAETCDDGNTNNQDACPSDCIIDTCAPNAGSDFTVSVNFAGSENVAGMTVFLDYPEGAVSIPGSGSGIPAGIITDLPGFAFGSSNDLDHALIQAVVDTAAYPSGLLFKVHFETCGLVPAPVAGDFACTVLSAGDDALVPVPGVTCSVSIP